MESVFSSLPGSPLAAQGMVRQPRAAWAWIPAGRALGRSSTGARPVACQVTGPGGSRLPPQPAGPRGGAGGGDTPVGAIPSSVSSPCPFPGAHARWGKGYGCPHSDMGSLRSKPRTFPLGAWGTRTKQGMSSLRQSPLGLPGMWVLMEGQPGVLAVGPAGTLGEWGSPRCSRGPPGRVLAAPLAICSCPCQRGAPTSQAADRSL